MLRFFLVGLYSIEITLKVNEQIYVTIVHGLSKRLSHEVFLYMGNDLEVPGLIMTVRH